MDALQVAEQIRPGGECGGVLGEHHGHFVDGCLAVVGVGQDAGDFPQGVQLMFEAFAGVGGTLRLAIGFHASGVGVSVADGVERGVGEVEQVPVEGGQVGTDGGDGGQCGVLTGR